VIAVRAVKALARGWWKLPYILRSVVLIATCFLIDTGIGNATVAASMLGVAIIGLLTVTFVFVEDRQRRIRRYRGYLGTTDRHRAASRTDRP
jgi:hypothetical protein